MSLYLPKVSAIVGLWLGNLNQDGDLEDWSVNENHGTVTGADHIETPFGSGLDFISGNSDKVSLGNIGNVKSVSCLVKADSITEYFIDMNGTANIDLNAGTIRANNFTSPIFYVNGNYDATPSMPANIWTHVVITTGTNVNASAVVLGLISANYSDMTISPVVFWSVQLNGNEVLALSRYFTEIFPARRL